MDSGLKQRLIGAVVLVAIAIIFLPSLFNQGGRKAVDLTTQIPPEPEQAVEALEIPPPRPPESAQPGQPAEENYSHPPVAESQSPETEPPFNNADSPPSSESETAPEPVLTDEGVPRGWSVQVGSFSQQSGADALLGQLVEKGYERSYIRSGEGANGTLYRVFVGPRINREDAESDRQKIDDTFQVESLLVEFRP